MTSKIKSLTLSIVILIFIYGIGNAQIGTIKGVLKDTITQEALIDAMIIVEGTAYGAVSEVDGSYSIELEPGIYNIKISNLGYDSLLIKDVRVTSGQTTLINASLASSKKEQVEVLILGTRLTNTDAAVVEEVKNAITIASGLSGEQISRSQDRDASEAIRRVPGISIVDNRFVMVRGLSERFNAVTLNNALTPSFEQDVKAFSFDIIPSQMIDRVLVYKSPSPELSGEFAGGAIMIFTRGIPTKNAFDIGLSTSNRPSTSLKTFYSPIQGKYDWIGYNDNANAHPKGVPPDYSETSGKYDDLKVSKLFKNDGWLPEKNKAPLDTRFFMNFTRKIGLGNGKDFGIVSSVNYSNTYLTTNAIRQRMDVAANPSDGSTPRFNFKEELYSQSTRLGALLNFALRIGTSNNIEFRNLYNHQGSSQYQKLSGIDLGLSNDFSKRYMLLKTYRGLYSGQLTGSHEYSKNTLFDWTVGYALGSRDQPDIKRYYQVASSESDQYKFVIVNGANSRFFGRIYGKTLEEIKMTSGNLRHIFEFKNAKNIKPELKTGWYLEDKKRLYHLKAYGYQNKLAAPDGTYYNNANIQNKTIEDLNDPAMWNNYDGLILTKGWSGSTSYSAQNSLIAYYAGLNIPYKDKFNIYSGVRVENNTQTVNLSHHIVSVLPSVNAAYNFSEKLKWRAAYGKTVNRPEFREAAAVNFFDFSSSIPINGNPDLKICEIYNSETRIEYYPRFGETFSFGLFNKDFQNPIEQQQVNGSDAITFVNAKSARSFGLEAEIKKSLDGIIVVKGFDLLKNCYINFNAALIKSRVKFDSTNMVTVKERPMMGQSPYIVNTGITYKNDKRFLMVNISYNVIGKRIVVADPQGSNVYEMPRNVLDLTINKAINRYTEIRFGIQDILNQRIQLVQDANTDGKVKRVNPTVFPIGQNTKEDSEYYGFKKGSYFTLGIVFRLL